MKNTRPFGSARPRVLAAGLLALAISTTGAFGVGGVAAAQPNTGHGGEWDLEAYDHCVSSYPYDPEEDPVRYWDHKQWCCIQSGGVWHKAGSTCVAPSGDGDDSSISPLTPFGPGPVAVHPIQPNLGPAA